MDEGSGPFIRDESGAVTVDWVVLSAAAVGLAALVATTMKDDTVALGDKVSTHMAGFDFEADPNAEN